MSAAVQAPRVKLGCAPQFDLLADFRFGETAPKDTAAWLVPLPVLEQSARQSTTALAETWAAPNAAAQIQTQNSIELNAAGPLLMGRIVVDALLADPEALERRVEAGVRALYTATRAEGFEHILRVWNYLPCINQGDGDAEIYRRFCVGRAAGMPDDAYPAGTAIGTSARVDALHMHWIAAREPGRAIENPRQVSAFEYPRQYGPQSPSFSRAMQMNDRLLVSGTASVLGHETRWTGDVVEQTREAMRNVQALLQEAGGTWETSEPVLRIYVRQAEDWPKVRAALLPLLPDGSHWVALLGDVCRSDLLVEVDGVLSV